MCVSAGADSKYLSSVQVPQSGLLGTSDRIKSFVCMRACLVYVCVHCMHVCMKFEYGSVKRS